jgi:hypothetical protein
MLWWSSTTAADAAFGTNWTICRWSTWTVAWSRADSICSTAARISGAASRSMIKERFLNRESAAEAALLTLERGNSTVRTSRQSGRSGSACRASSGRRMKASSVTS